MVQEWKPPEEFGEYRVLRRVGAGGMGAVYLAHDGILDRAVAVKFLAATDSAARDRFLVEARALARLQHPNVVAVYRVGNLGRRSYLVSEFVHGAPLDRLPRPVPWARVLEIGVGLARGLAAAHRRGVLHRDIKPSNAILADSGEVKLLDFGLAKLTAQEDAGARSATPCETPEPREGPFEATTIGARPKGDDPTLAPPQSRPPDEPAGVAHFPTPRLTREGAILGTPYYMAPEAWRGEPATPQTDVYSLGLLLYELCAGHAPNRDVAADDLSEVVQSRDPAPLSSVVADAPADFAQVIDRCIQRAPADRYASGDELRAALERLLPDAHEAPIPEGNPYRGLQAFEAEHRALFFGRASEIDEVVDRLRSEWMVVVAGDSGVGKSSLCRAGVLPAIGEAAARRQEAAEIVRLVPGRHPVQALAAAIAGRLGLESERLTVGLIEGDEQLIARARGALLGRGARRLILFVDQLEELVTLAMPDEAAAFADGLVRVFAGTSNGRVLATVRGDYLTRLAALPGLGGELGRALYLLRPLEADAIREAIVGPLRVKDGAFEAEELVDQLVRAGANADGGLPLLQFALAQLWEARDGNTITARSLDRVGGVEGALARHADHVIAHLLPTERAAARRQLVRLVTGERTRTRRTEEELRADVDPDSGRALDALVRGRLVIAREIDGATAFEVAHEILISSWGTLRGWLDSSAEARAVRHRLETAAGEWDRLGRVKDALWSGRQIAEASLVEPAELAVRERDFLARSRAGARRRKVAAWAALLGLPLILAGGWAGLRVRDRRAAADRQAEARRVLDKRVAALLAESSRVTGALEGLEVAERRRRALEAFDRRDPAAEALWQEARLASRQEDRALAAATQLVESASHLDPERADLRARLAELLYRRALLAEREGRTDQTEEHIQRLALYDDGQALLKRWSAPARLTIDSQPAAAVTLQRYSQVDSRLVAGPARPLGPTPIAELTCPPGSYLLRFEARGREPVLAPILVERGDELAIDVPLRRAGSIPPGFVYVPPGRFLVGTRDENLRTLFLFTVPLHQSTTGPYLIARHETTFADWIEYLEALPAAERRKRLPRSTSDLDNRGAVSLTRVGARYRLVMRPTVRELSASQGEEIRYPERDRRAAQDWLRMPVSGIAAEDAEAYAAWLQDSGRLPGARLCTDHEWERAARGADGREYPSGERLGRDDANFDETYGKTTLAFGPDEVGSHPGSVSPFGIEDMAGNTWEWVRSTLSENGHAARGGGYYEAELTLRTNNRSVPEPSFRELGLGLRVCADLPR